MRVIWLPLLFVSLTASALGTGGLSPPRPKLPWCAPPFSARLFCGVSCGWVCDPPPHPQTVTDSVIPAYIILYVTYAPPGRSSTMEYANSTELGSTVAIMDSTATELLVTVGSGSKEQTLVPSGSVEIKTDDKWGTTTATQTDISVNIKDGYKMFGEEDGINHDNDEVWFWARPALLASYTPASYYGPENLTWMVDGRAPTPALYYLTVGELRGTVPLSPGVRAALDAWGIDPARDFPEMLKADPAANGSVPNQQMDAARYDFVGEWPYEPVTHPGDIPSPQTHSIDRKVKNTSETKSDVEYNVSVKVGASLAFLWLPLARWSVLNGWTWHHTTDVKDSVQNENVSTITVGQPPYGYAGPTLLRVYEDKVWKTFRFELGWH